MKILKHYYRKIRNVFGWEVRTAKLEDEIHTTRQYIEDLYYPIEYKIWQYNTNTNKILYELMLKTKEKKKNFAPMVSIIIPVYNGNNFLAEAIKSALAQTYKNVEIIVVNDGSRDYGRTKRVALKFGDKIRYYEKKNGGVSSALNLGIKHMKGQYFAWLSHDDVIDPDHIERLVNHITYKGHEDHIPFASFKIIDENSNLRLRETIIAQIHCNDFKLSYCNNELSLLQGEINGGSVLIPRKAFDEFGFFNEKLRISQERDLWSRMIKGYHFINIPFDTASIRTHPQQVTNTNPKVMKETNRKNLEIISGLSDNVAQRLFGSRYNLYEHLKRFYRGNQYMIKYIDQLSKNIK